MFFIQSKGWSILTVSILKIFFAGTPRICKVNPNLLAFFVFGICVHTDRQTDGRTDERTDTDTMHYKIQVFYYKVIYYL